MNIKCYIRNIFAGMVICVFATAPAYATPCGPQIDNALSSVQSKLADNQQALTLASQALNTIKSQYTQACGANNNNCPTCKQLKSILDSQNASIATALFPSGNASQTNNSPITSLAQSSNPCTPNCQACTGTFEALAGTIVTLPLAAVVAGICFGAEHCPYCDDAMI